MKTKLNGSHITLIIALTHAFSFAQQLPKLLTPLTASTQLPPPVAPLTPTSRSGKIHEMPPADKIPHGKELVSIDFPNGVNLSDIIKTVSMWTGKNFVLGQGVSGGAKISIISQEPITKEEAYQAFLSALNISGFTTVETGKIVKILPISNAKSSNIKTYYGSNWAPATDEIINQVIPLNYIDVNTVVNQLRPLLGLTQYAPFTTTNSLILTDTGNRIRRIMEVIKLLDDKTSQSQVSIIPVNYTDAKDMATKVTDIFGARGGTTISLQKAVVDERTNSIILVGPAHTLDDIVRFIQKIDKPALDQSIQAFIRVRPLDYADAEKLAQTLQALTQNTNSKTTSGGAQRPPYLPAVPNASQQQNTSQQSGAGAVATDISGAKITADKSSNSLIIQGSKSAFNELDGIISQLDKRRAQVYIEANMIDLSIGNDLTWSPAAIGGGVVGNKVTIPFGFNAGQAIPFSQQTTTGGSATNPLGAAAASNAILGILSNTTVNIGGLALTPGALIFALKTDSNNNVLQTPSMMVSDNEAANFSAAQEINVLVTSSNPSGIGTVQNSQKYDVTTALKVTPQISRSNSVNLKINLQLDTLLSTDANGAPTVNKRSAESVVTVQDGQTAVLGGITVNTMKHAESKVPLLGDIPVIGWLFKQVQDIKDKSSLTLLITPHVVRNADDLARIYEENM
ncbi:MAG: type II secretion system secretin GspD, partial [Bdellovibrionota bacterium]